MKSTFNLSLNRSFALIAGGLVGAISVPAAADPDPELSVDKGEVIVVTGSLSETPLGDSVVATEVVTRKEIEDRGAVDVAEILEGQPGLEVITGFRGTSVRMLGFDAQHILILVNGKPAIGRIGGAVDLGRFSADEIERIEIVKGAGSVLYGSDAIGGVINIITRKASRPLEADFEQSAGTFGSLGTSGHLGTRRGGLSTRAGAGFERRDAYDLTPEDLTTTSAAFRDFSATLASGYDFNDRTSIETDFEYTRRHSDGIDQAEENHIFDRRGLTETAGARVQAHNRFGRHRFTSGFRFAHFRDQFLYDQRMSSALDSVQQTRQSQADVDLKYDVVLGQHFLTAGMTGTGEWLKAERLSQHGKRERLGVFLQDEWVVSESRQWTVSPGVRLDLDSQFGDNVTPRVATRFAPSPWLTLRGSYGWGYRAPDFRELYLSFDNAGAGYELAGNPELRPETSQNVTLGVEVKPTERVWASAGLFFNEIDDLIVIELGGLLADNKQRFHYENVASARTQGAELQLRVRPLSFATVDASYTFTETLDRTTMTPLFGRARHSGTFGVTTVSESLGTRLRVNGRWSGRHYAGEPGEELTVSRAIRRPSFDARISQRAWMLEIFAGVKNIFDAGDPLFLPDQPRTFYAGVSARY